MYSSSSLRQKSRHGYQRLGHGHGHDHASIPFFSRSTSVPNEKKIAAALPTLKVSASTKKHMKETTDSSKTKRSTKEAAKTHPLLSFFHVSRRKKPAAVKPEFIRYLEYLKEGGAWDPQTNRPVMHFK